MKTHAITDHVPESELLAITPEGAARWLTRKGLVKGTIRHKRGDWYTSNDKGRSILLVTTGGAGIVETIEDAHKRWGIPPRTIIAEMQADSRIVAECARIVARSPNPAQPTENKGGAAFASEVKT